MTTNDTPLALIAEDEALLARSLKRQLAEAWPGLRLAEVAEDGLAATEQALALLPDLLFLDIRMPGRTGLEVAEAVNDDWPEDRPLPLLVFVTAFDEFAVAGMDLRRARRQALLQPRDRDAQALQAPAPAGQERIKVIRAGVGNTVRMIPVADVVCLEATDKYVNVVTTTGEALVRLSLRELAARLEGEDFMQVHRAVYVATRRIRSATRDEFGHYSLAVDGLARPLKVSRAFAHLFKPM